MTDRKRETCRLRQPLPVGRLGRAVRRPSDRGCDPLRQRWLRNRFQSRMDKLRSRERPGGRVRVPETWSGSAPRLSTLHQVGAADQAAAPLRCDRGDIDNRPIALRDHHGREGTNDVEGTSQIDGDYLVKVLAVDLVIGARADNAGAMNEGVDTIERALDLQGRTTRRPWAKRCCTQPPGLLMPDDPRRSSGLRHPRSR